jgi:putative tricarboxylic transport membrane protein
MRPIIYVLLAVSLVAPAAYGAECISPARPDGGFHRTCELIRSALIYTGASKQNVIISQLPGGVGAVSYNAIITQRNAEPNTFVAFSGGSLLNIAQRKFGNYSEQDVKWLATLGLDHGVLIVRNDSRFRTLKDLIDALNRNPDKLVFGGSGGVGAQDWTKASLVARAAKVSYKSLRYVGFEGGGDSTAALAGGYVDVVSGDVSEAIRAQRMGKPVRILAIFAGERLPALNEVPTAREQGYDIQWSNVRGVYMGPHVSDADYRRWVAIFSKMMSHPAFVTLCEKEGLMPFPKVGAEADNAVHTLVDKYRRLEFQPSTKNN